MRLSRLRGLLLAGTLLAALPLPAAAGPVPTSHALLVDLQAFMHERDVQVESLTADGMVRLMVDWYRFARAGAAPSSGDALVFRYGGWSEGCATAFNLSLLRRVQADGGEADGVAGVTMMFEPSGQLELKPYSSTSADWKSLDEFLRAVEGSPAFRLLGDAKPMSVQVEAGGLR
ncbi:MAG TPA: hypothetical protein VFV71_01790 [Burkholderiales bacterium]|nr:hypothetical protein [Burkholderiales bacterium]